MIKGDIRVVFATELDSEFDDMLAEVYYKDELLILISQEQGFSNLDIHFYPQASDVQISFQLAQFEEAIAYAKQRLWELRKVGE